MNLLVIPFHDWRKCLREGFRTRDAHFIEHLLSHRDVSKIVIINRPITLLECIVKKMSWKTPGELIYSGRNWQIVKVHEKGYVFDYLSHSFMKHFILRNRWYFRAYAQNQFINSLKKAFEIIKFNNYNTLSFNIFASHLLSQLNTRPLLFDAFDNFNLFPFHKSLLREIRDSYMLYGKISTCWTTNSKVNKSYYCENYLVGNCTVIESGVDIEKFTKEYEIPVDLDAIERPVIGFGGKISHLVDTELLNYIVNENPNMSFVIIGPVLNKKIFKKISFRPNVFYLGDKHYGDYPAYIKNFDVCILPYVTEEKSHGADSLKLYEYIAARKPVIATKGNGAERLDGFVKLAANKYEFATLIKDILSVQTSENDEVSDIPHFMSWSSRTDLILKCLKCDNEK